MDDRVIGFPEPPATVQAYQGSRWGRLSAFSKGFVGAIAGGILLIVVGTLCVTAYQDHMKVNAMFTYLNQRVAAEQQARPQPQLGASRTDSTAPTPEK